MSKTTELKPCPVCEDCGASLPPSINEEYTAEEWHTRAEVYITHPITGEPLDKSQCKRVITQMYARISELKAIGEKDNPKPLKDRCCPTCGNGFLSSYGIRDECCSRCGQRLDWSNNELE
ncbi:hypothetical protein [Oxalobacter paraformigenes]|uniref:Uncharacterized protein n=1 Tax=Oxalobacter paraformigenes TaxID=556268 RepID=T5LSX8_9BURK|nr:hypothetical protein [Oxalobacter paraformigenes]EQM95159.1 hypothetical protein OFAG_02255 [Oxalobacter paraformigenes]